jgi:hypothetical protein
VGQTLDRFKKNPEAAASSFKQQEVLIYGDSVLGHQDDEYHVTFFVFSVDHSHRLDHSYPQGLARESQTIQASNP